MKSAGDITTELELDLDKDRLVLHGRLDQNLKVIEKALGVLISYRGDKLFIRGGEGPVQKALALVNELKDISRSGFTLKPEDIKYAVQRAASGQEASLGKLFSRNISLPSRKGLVVPKTEVQGHYIEAIGRKDMVFGIGPAGTGKTYLAMAMAVNSLLKKEVSRLVLCRPAVEAGEKLGFLPGDMLEKVNPYFRPLHDALFDLMEREKALKLIERDIIEIAPLAFMRGRTLNDAFVILDEAQNTTTEQMKMFLTRLGFNSKTVITGDVTQIDLPPEKTSGLVQAKKILAGIDGIEVVYFTDKDVVRHRLVQDIVKAYDRFTKQQEKNRKSSS